MWSVQRDVWWRRWLSSALFDCCSNDSSDPTPVGHRRQNSSDPHNIDVVWLPQELLYQSPKWRLLTFPSTTIWHPNSSEWQLQGRWQVPVCSRCVLACFRFTRAGTQELIIYYSLIMSSSSIRRATSFGPDAVKPKKQSNEELPLQRFLYKSMSKLLEIAQPALRELRSV